MTDAQKIAQAAATLERLLAGMRTDHEERITALEARCEAKRKPAVEAELPPPAEPPPTNRE